MEEKLAFVLGGGGSHGALQVGALRAALEANFYPDFLVGTSIGSINSAFLALHGFNVSALNLLEQAWLEASVSDFLPGNLVWLSVNALMERTMSANQQRIQHFFSNYGLTPQLKFRDLKEIPFYAVAAELNSCEPEVFGVDPDQSVVDGVMASCALPPWISPQIDQEKFLVDGGFVSNLPLEPAMRLGATRILAFSLEEAFLGAIRRPFFSRTIQAVISRQREMELKLAQACGVPVLRIRLIPPGDYPLWDFSHTREWIELGYQTARQTFLSQKNAVLDQEKAAFPVCSD